MEMQELLDQLKELCAGKSAEEIEQDLSETTHSERIPDVSVFAKYLASLAGEPDEEPSEGPDEEPGQDEGEE